MQKADSLRERPARVHPSRLDSSHLPAHLVEQQFQTCLALCLQPPHTNTCFRLAV